jgi:ATP-dependent Clp protease ATP-binding subunit ClpC
LRDTEKQLTGKKDAGGKQWKAGGMDAVAEVTAELIAEVLATATGIPVFKLTEEESQRLLRMEDELHRRVIGQDVAIKSLSHPAHPGRAEGPQAARRLVHLRRPVRGRQDGAVQDARGLLVRR